MNYLQEFEAALRVRLASIIDPKDEGAVHWLETVVEFVKKAVLESYRNGLAASKSGRKCGHASAIAAGKLKPVKPAQ